MGVEMATDDRRNFKRKPKQSIIHFQLVESEKESELDDEGMMLDYSPGGLRFSAKKSIKKNTKIYIKLDSEEWGKELTVVWRDPNRNLLEVIGQVMWCLESRENPGEFEIGAMFVGDVEQ